MKNIAWLRIVIWPLLLIAVWMMFATVISPFQALVRTIVVFAFFGFIVWFNISVLIPAYLERRKFLIYCLISLLAAVALAFVRVGIEAKLGVQLRPFFERMAENNQRRYTFLIVVNHVIAIGVALLYYFGRKWSEANKRESILQRQKLEAELQFLKAQVSPHFLFNTLNNIYTLAYLKDDKAPAMVLKLSDLMRYLLDHGTSSEVSLADEVRFLENYLELQKLKNSAYQKIVPEISGSLGQARIPPLLLLPFIENLFKHSDLESNPDGWAKVEVVMNDHHQLTLSVSNSKTAKNDYATKAGFGIRNLRQRLDMAYGDRYKMEIRDEENTFNVNLMLPLK